MKRIAIIAALALGLSASSASAAAVVVCTDDVLGPLQIPVVVCVDVPELPPIVVPPVDPPETPVTPVEPAPEEEPAAPQPDSPATVDPSPAPADTSNTPVPTVTPHVSTPSEKAIDVLAALVFPWMVFFALLALIFGVSRVYAYFVERKSRKRLTSVS